MPQMAPYNWTLMFVLVATLCILLLSLSVSTHSSTIIPKFYTYSSSRSILIPLFEW